MIILMLSKQIHLNEYRSRNILKRIFKVNNDEFISTYEVFYVKASKEKR